MSFHQAATALRQKALEDKEIDTAEPYDVWGIISVRYGLQVTGPCSDFYKLVAKNPVFAKMVLQSLEQWTEIPVAHDLVKPLEKLDMHITTQLMKAIATLSASNKTKRAGRGGAARQN